MSPTTKIVAVGDSVAWGQGLLLEHKYAARICRARYPEMDALVMNAHSGAIIGARPAETRTSIDPEVPAPCPSILSQIDAVADPSTVDLVLINGGINDVGVQTILNPFTTEEALAASTRQACHDDMKVLLEKTVSVFTRTDCLSIVTGYYPILSGDSRIFRSENDAESFEKLLDMYGIKAPPPGERTDLLEILARLSVRFWVESTRSLDSAVSETAARFGLGDRMRFVPGPFTEKNALFATDPWLFGFGSSLNLQDELVAARTESCNRSYGDLFSRVLCQCASVGHPNLTGAQRIAESILEALGGTRVA